METEEIQSQQARPRRRLFSQIFETENETKTRKMCIFETEIETETRKMVETETESLADL